MARAGPGAVARRQLSGPHLTHAGRDLRHSSAVVIVHVGSETSVVVASSRALRHAAPAGIRTSARPDHEENAVRVPQMRKEATL